MTTEVQTMAWIIQEQYFMHIFGKSFLKEPILTSYYIKSLRVLLLNFHYMRASRWGISVHWIPNTVTLEKVKDFFQNQRAKWIHSDWSLGDGRRCQKSHPVGIHIKITTHKNFLVFNVMHYFWSLDKYFITWIRTSSVEFDVDGLAVLINVRVPLL